WVAVTVDSFGRAPSKQQCAEHVKYVTAGHPQKNVACRARPRRDQPAADDLDDPRPEDLPTPPPPPPPPTRPPHLPTPPRKIYPLPPPPAPGPGAPRPPQPPRRQ